MFVRLLNSVTGYAIALNASFSVPFANAGNGWWYLQVGGDATVTVNAVGYNTMSFNTDNYEYMYVSLQSTTPTKLGNCWS